MQYRLYLQEYRIKKREFQITHPPYTPKMSRKTKYRVSWELKISLDTRLDFAATTWAIPKKQPTPFYCQANLFI